MFEHRACVLLEATYLTTTISPPLDLNSATKEERIRDRRSLGLMAIRQSAAGKVFSQFRESERIYRGSEPGLPKNQWETREGGDRKLNSLLLLEKKLFPLSPRGPIRKRRTSRERYSLALSGVSQQQGSKIAQQFARCKNVDMMVTFL